MKNGETSLLRHACNLSSLVVFIRSTSKKKVDLIILEGEKCPSVRTSVPPYVRLSTKSFFDLHEIWYTGRGR